MRVHDGPASTPRHLGTRHRTPGRENGDHVTDRSQLSPTVTALVNEWARLIADNAEVLAVTSAASAVCAELLAETTPETRRCLAVGCHDAAWQGNEWCRAHVACSCSRTERCAQHPMEGV